MIGIPNVIQRAIQRAIRTIIQRRSGRSAGRRWPLGAIVLGLILWLGASSPLNAQAPAAAGSTLETNWANSFIQPWAAPWVGAEADRPQAAWIEFDGRPVFQIAAPPKELARRTATITTQLQGAGDRFLSDPKGSLAVTIELSASAPAAAPNSNAAVPGSGSAPAVAAPAAPAAPLPTTTLPAAALVDAPRILVNGRYIMTVTALDAGTQLTQPRIYATSVKTAIEESLQQARADRQPAALGQQVRSSLAIWLVALGAHLMLGWGLQRLDRLSHSTPPVDPKPNDSFPLAAWLQRQRRDHWLAIGRILIQIAQPSVWATASLWVLGNFPATRWLQARIFDALEAYLKLGLATLVTYIAILLSYIAVDRATAILTAGTQIAPRTRPRLQQRVLTLSSILKSFLTVLLVILGAIVGLAGIGVDVGPLIAGAGLIGVALSLASQNLIKDAINGFLILAEDQFSVGDAIAVGNLTGRVEALTLRVTKLRDAEQRLIVIPNSEIRTVANLSNHYSQADLRIPIAYGADLDQALAILNQLSDDLAADPQWSEILLDRPQVLGIDEFSASGSMVRVWIRTTPLQQWGAAREFRRRVAIAFNAAQIGLMGQTDPPAPIVPLEMEDNGARDRAEERDNAERDTLAQQSQPRNPDPATTTTKSPKSDSNGQGAHHAHASRDRDGGDPAPIADGMTASAPNPGADLDAGPIDPSAKTS